jgi:hypothetical protein
MESLKRIPQPDKWIGKVFARNHVGAGGQGQTNDHEQREYEPIEIIFHFIIGKTRRSSLLSA